MEDTQAQAAAEPVTTDTSATTDTSEANLQVDNGAPEAAQPTQEVTAEVNATDTAEEKLYAGKYKTAEDMEKAYQELNSKFTNTAQEKAELSRILNEAFATPEAQAPVVEDPYADVADPVNQEVETLKRNQAVLSFVMMHQDADAASMQEVLASDPIVKQISGHEAKLEYAYMKSQNKAQAKALVEAQKTGAQAATAKIAEKQVAQVEAATQTSAPIDENADLQEQMRSGTLAEREAARRAYIKKNLVNL